MKIVILAGGYGTRLSEYTDLIPKPMVTINGKPILVRLISIYAHYGYKDFYIALGYKSEVICNYFNCKLNESTSYLIGDKTVNISLFDTGKNTMTGGRLKRLEKVIGNKTFMLTYGDGLADINIHNLEKFHKQQNSLVTVTAVRPPARFGALKIEGNKVINFEEKNPLSEGWINGGFFVIEPDFFKFIYDDNSILERTPLESIAEKGQLTAYKHQGFWQCMDTKRDRDILEEVVLNGDEPWKL
jgi:glucose-1-phosphate cytidylyltransferase